MRLRFTKKKRDAKDRQRMTIEQVLQPALDYFKENISTNRPRNTKTFLKRAKEVVNLASSWKKHQTVKELEHLVEGITRLYQVDNLEEICSKSVSDTSTRKHLLNMVHKVSAYRECARRLYKSALEFPLVRRMQVEVVELPNTAFKRPQVKDGYQPSLDSTISRLKDLKNNQKDVVQIHRFLGIKESLEVSQDRYERQVKATIRESKIHAEIQLLYYCRTVLRTESLLPRVLCSSKSACWLCNAFILFDSKSNTPKFYTPRCHGKLYPGWRLPVSEGWGDIVCAKFNQELDRRMTDSVKTLWDRKQKTTYVGGVESDLSDLTWELPGPLNSASLKSGKSSGLLQNDNAAPVPDTPGPLEPTELVGESDNRSREETISEGIKAEEVTGDGTSTIPVPAATPENKEEPTVVVSPVPISVEAEESPNGTPAVVVEELSPEARDSASQPDARASSDLPSGATNEEHRTPCPSERGLAESQGNSGQPRASFGTLSSINRNTRTSNIVPYKNTSKVLTLGRLRLRFEYAGTLEQEILETAAPGHLFCTMELLSPEDIELLKLEQKPLIGAESLTSKEVSHSLDEAKSLYLTLDKAVVRVTMRPVSNAAIGLPSQNGTARTPSTPERAVYLRR
jgi:hypothetical protein